MEKIPHKERTAHANFKKGLSDYHDGENVSHYLGNDDYQELMKNEKNSFDGKEALGNDFLERVDELETYFPSIEDQDYE